MIIELLMFATDFIESTNVENTPDYNLWPIIQKNIRMEKYKKLEV